MKKRRIQPDTLGKAKNIQSASIPEYEFLRNKKNIEKNVINLRLNKHIANAGICSRREADKLIASGEIKVNGETITELGYKLAITDKVTYKGKLLQKEKLVYILLNKPKDLITTTKDPEGRKTVMSLFNKIDQRIYPVGRLDRNTTGILLLTNDGELAETLSHPSYNIRKIYEVEINSPITEEDISKIRSGVELEDGLIKVDEIVIISEDGQKLGIEIHSGKNRIVRRIFEHFGYDVIRLDRVMYSFLTKKDLPRGKWRYLKESEVIRLKHLGSPKKKSGKKDASSKSGTDSRKHH